MTAIPNEVLMLVNDPKASKTFSTKSVLGRIHTIFVGSMLAVSPDQLAFAHILMKRTNQNLLDMRKNDLLSVSVTLGMTSYEIIAKVKESRTSGPIYDMVVEALTRSDVEGNLVRYGMRVHGVWIIEPVEVWNESPGPSAGTRVV